MGNTKNMNLKPLLLILGHLTRDDTVYDPAFKESLAQILKASTAHVLMMGEVCMELNQLARMGGSAKKIGYKAFATIVGFDQAEIKKYRGLLRQHRIPNGSIETFCRLSKE